ncbi:MAG: zinc-binding dehydrogenase [Planctomycetota bacterium]
MPCETFQEQLEPSLELGLEGSHACDPPTPVWRLEADTMLDPATGEHLRDEADDGILDTAATDASRFRMMFSQTNQSDLQELSSLVERAELTPVIDVSLGLQETDCAFRRLESSEHVGTPIVLLGCEQGPARIRPEADARPGPRDDEFTQVPPLFPRP